MEIKKEFCCEEIATCLCRLSTNSTDGIIADGVLDGLYWLDAAAQNPNNHDYFRHLWNVLQDVASVHQNLIYNE